MLLLHRAQEFAHYLRNPLFQSSDLKQLQGYFLLFQACFGIQKLLSQPLLLLLELDGHHYQGFHQLLLIFYHGILPFLWMISLFISNLLLSSWYWDLIYQLIHCFEPFLVPLKPFCCYSMFICAHSKPYSSSLSKLYFEFCGYPRVLAKQYLQHPQPAWPKPL